MFSRTMMVYCLTRSGIVMANYEVSIQIREAWSHNSGEKFAFICFNLIILYFHMLDHQKIYLQLEHVRKTVRRLKWMSTMRKIELISRIHSQMAIELMKRIRTMKKFVCNRSR
ncbi:uncharacterized protein LOC141607062 [Silene latifolia]|uniref:uncharacterized protein LOC141607062 n=1 Tax=Silene latifolia TaxID=37657 RepID=UPI003D78422C